MKEKRMSRKSILRMTALATLVAAAFAVPATVYAADAPNNAGAKNATTPNTSDRDRGPEFTTQPRLPANTANNPAPKGAANATTPGTNGPAAGTAGASRNTTSPTEQPNTGIARDSANLPNPTGAANATTPGTMGKDNARSMTTSPGEGGSTMGSSKTAMKKAKRADGSRDVSARFNSADANGDGQLSRSEYEQMMSSGAKSKAKY
jgi:hypothetical protein